MVRTVDSESYMSRRILLFPSSFSFLLIISTVLAAAEGAKGPAPCATTKLFVTPLSLIFTWGFGI